MRFSLCSFVFVVVCGLGCGADDDPDVRDAPRDVPSEDVSEDTPRDTPRDTPVDTTTDDGETVRDDGSSDTSEDTGDLDPEWVEMEGAPGIERATSPQNAFVTSWVPCRPVATEGCLELAVDGRYERVVANRRVTTTLLGRRALVHLGLTRALSGGGRLNVVQVLFNPDDAVTEGAWRTVDSSTAFTLSGTEGKNVAFEVVHPENLSRIYRVSADELTEDAFPTGELTDVEQPGAAAIVRMLVSDTTVATLIGASQKFFVFEGGRRVERGRDLETGVARGAVASLAMVDRRLIWAVRDDYLVTAADLDAPAEMLFDAADSEPIFLMKADGEHIVWTTMFDAERSALWVSPFATTAAEFDARRLRTLVNFADPHLGDGRVAYRARDPGRIYLIDLDTGRQRTFDLPGDLNPAAIARIAGDEVIVLVAPGATADSRLLRLDFSDVPYDEE